MIIAMERDRSISWRLLAGIIIAPPVFIWPLTGHEYSNVTRVKAFAWLLFWGLLVLTSYAPPATPEPVAEVAKVEREKPAHPEVWNRITPGIYGAISLRSRYSQTAALIGPGKRKSSEPAMIRGEWTTVDVYLWENDDGSGMTLMVDKDRIVGKAQVGILH